MSRSDRVGLSASNISTSTTSRSLPSLYFSNCRSLRHQIDNLRDLVSSSSQPPSIIALAETWLDESIDDSELNLPSYNLYRRDRDLHGGGVALYVNSALFKVQKICHHRTEEVLYLNALSGSGSLLICVVYHPPHRDLLSDFKKAISSCLQDRPDKAIVVGDFNVDTSRSHSSKVEHLKSLFRSFDMEYYKTSSTHISRSSSSTIDLIFASDDLVDECHVAPDLGSSDHRSLKCLLKVSAYKKRKRLVQEKSESTKRRAVFPSSPH